MRSYKINVINTERLISVVTYHTFSQQCAGMQEYRGEGLQLHPLPFESVCHRVPWVPILPFYRKYEVNIAKGLLDWYREVV